MNRNAIVLAMRKFAPALLCLLLVGGCSSGLNIGEKRTLKVTILWPAKRDLAQASSLRVVGKIFDKPWFTKIVNRPSDAASSSNFEETTENILPIQADIDAFAYSGLDGTGTIVGTSTHQGVTVSGHLTIDSVAEP